MTARERFLRVMNYEPVERPLVVALEPFEAAGVRRWRREGLTDQAPPAPALGMDWLELVPLNFGPLPDWEYRVVAEEEEYITAVGWLGATVRRRKDEPEMYYGHVDHAVKTRQDWEECKWRFRADTPGRLGEDLEALAARLEGSAQPVGLHIFPFFFRLAFYLMGMERFMTAFYEEPELIHDMFSFWGEFVLATLRPVLGNVRLDFVTFAEDLAYKQGPHISPRIYQEFWLPYQDPIVEAVHAAGVPVVCMWTAGNAAPLLGLMLEHGINCTWPLERAAGMDPPALRARFGRELRLGGGVPKEALIAGPAAVDRELDYLRPLMAQGGYVPALDDMVPPEVPLATYRYYLERMREIRL
jgi:uroporphyrinogen decarboxylase